jgi:hypothetical protein
MQTYTNSRRRNRVAEREGIMERQHGIAFEAGSLRTGLEVIANNLGKRLDEDNPLLNAQLPDGSRICAYIPPAVKPAPGLTIRKFTSRHFTADDLIVRATLTASLSLIADSFRLLPAKEEANSEWTAREWSIDRKGWIFITSQPAEREALRPLHSLWIFKSSSDRVWRSAVALSVSRSQNAHFNAEITRHTYLSSSGSTANAARYGSVSCPSIWAFNRARYGFILSERTSSWAPGSVLISLIGSRFVFPTAILTT